jgi:predicted RNA-binding Zn-ribbon protein involved in translation (DUF1610 family)
MSSEYRCPNCGVTDTRYRSTSGSHVCNRCGHQWGANTQTENPGFWGKIIEWAKAHPFGTLLTLSIVVTIAAFSASFDPETSTGDKTILWIIAGGLFLITFGYGKYRESRKASADSDDDGEAENTFLTFENDETGPLLCASCGSELDDKANFCIQCGTQV